MQNMRAREKTESTQPKPLLKEVVARWLGGHDYDMLTIGLCSKPLQEADSLLILLSQHGIVQLDENQDFSPFAGIPKDFKRVRPLEG